MDTNSMIEEILEKGQSTVKKAAKQTASDLAQAVKGQITGSQNDQGTNEQANAAVQNQQKMSDDEAKRYLQGLYGSSEKNPDQNKGQEENQEEKVKLEALRKKLHSDYYQALVNPPKPQEEAVTEKLEREKEEDRWELEQKKAEKPPPLPATQKVGTGEYAVGVSG